MSTCEVKEIGRLGSFVGPGERKGCPFVRGVVVPLEAMSGLRRVVDAGGTSLGS